MPVRKLRNLLAPALSILLHYLDLVNRQSNTDFAAGFEAAHSHSVLVGQLLLDVAAFHASSSCGVLSTVREWVLVNVGQGG